MTKPKAYYQAYLVLDCLSKEEYSLIPKSLLDEITSKMEKDDSIKVDKTIPLEKQKIDEKTYDILDRVIRAIEKAYGKDAIDNPEKYAKIDEIEVDLEPPKKENVKPQNNNNFAKPNDNRQNDNSRKRLRELEDENIRLKGIISALEEENKKIDKAKELFIDYKEVVSKKDSKIKELNEEINELKKANSELHSQIESLPKLVRKIFIKDDVKMLNNGEKR